jgi:ketosteroid isomerase-like protein
MNQGLPTRALAVLAKLVLAAMFFISLQGCIGNPSARTAAEGQIRKQLSVQADAWDKAIVRKDRAAIEANIAEDFRQIDRRGNVLDKASFVADLTSPELEIDPYTVEDFDIRIYGDVALLCGRTRMTGRYQGKAFTSHYRYIDIYVRRGEEWKIVSVQISPIPT